MPTYDYRCRDCGHELEAFQFLSEARLTTCPACGAEALERQLGAGVGVLSGLSREPACPVPSCAAEQAGACAGGACPMMA